MSSLFHHVDVLRRLVARIMRKPSVPCQNPLAPAPLAETPARGAILHAAAASPPRGHKTKRTGAMNIKVGKQAIAEASQKLSNWGRWGKDDQIGTLNHVTPEDIVKAASLI